MVYHHNYTCMYAHTHKRKHTHTVGSHYHGNRFFFHRYRKTWTVYKLISQLTKIETMATKYIDFQLVFIKVDRQTNRPTYGSAEE